LYQASTFFGSREPFSREQLSAPNGRVQGIGRAKCPSALFRVERMIFNLAQGYWRNQAIALKTLRREPRSGQVLFEVPIELIAVFSMPAEPDGSIGANDKQICIRLARLRESSSLFPVFLVVDKG